MPKSRLEMKPKKKTIIRILTKPGPAKSMRTSSRSLSKEINQEEISLEEAGNTGDFKLSGVLNKSRKEPNIEMINANFETTSKSLGILLKESSTSVTIKEDIKLSRHLDPVEEVSETRLELPILKRKLLFVDKVRVRPLVLMKPSKEPDIPLFSLKLMPRRLFGHGLNKSSLSIISPTLDLSSSHIKIPTPKGSRTLMDSSARRDSNAIIESGINGRDFHKLGKIKGKPISPGSPSRPLVRPVVTARESVDDDGTRLEIDKSSKSIPAPSVSDQNESVSPRKAFVDEGFLEAARTFAKASTGKEPLKRDLAQRLSKSKGSIFTGTSEAFIQTVLILSKIVILKEGQPIDDDLKNSVGIILHGLIGHSWNESHGNGRLLTAEMVEPIPPLPIFNGGKIWTLTTSTTHLSSLQDSTEDTGTVRKGTDAEITRPRARIDSCYLVLDFRDLDRIKSLAARGGNLFNFLSFLQRLESVLPKELFEKLHNVDR